MWELQTAIDLVPKVGRGSRCADFHDTRNYLAKFVGHLQRYFPNRAKNVENMGNILFTPSKKKYFLICTILY